MAMNEYTTFHKVLDYLQYYQEQSPMLNTFGYGNLVDFGKNVSGSSVNYPFLFVVPQSIEYQENMTIYYVSMIFADILNWDLSNEKDCVSDMSWEAKRFLAYLKYGQNTLPILYDNMDVNFPVQAIPFFERFGDHVAGVAMEVPLIVYDTLDACDYYPTPTPSASQTTPTPTPSITATPTVTPTITPSPTGTPLFTQTPTMTTTPTPTPGISSILVFSGQSLYQSCNFGTPTVIYFVDNGLCTPCLPFNCFPCLQNTPMYSDPTLLNLIPNGFYSKEMAPGQTFTWEFVNGLSNQYIAPPCPPNPTPSPTGVTHSYSWTGYTSQISECNAYTGSTTTVTLYGNDPNLDQNTSLFDSPSGPNTTNLYGSYSLWNGSFWICFNLDSYGVPYTGYNLCSAYC